jgi:uncharacterized protein
VDRLPQTVRISEPQQPNGCAIVLTHGAGSNLDGPVLRAVAESFAAAGWLALRCNMAYRDERSKGPPFTANKARDRESQRAAVEHAPTLVKGDVYLGGHSYGGRQSSMLAAGNPGLVSGLLLLSYPLHPPAKPEQLRTAHFPDLRTPTLLVHGSRDPFGGMEELSAAIQAIPAPTALITAEGAGHDLTRIRSSLIPEVSNDHHARLIEGLRLWLQR